MKNKELLSSKNELEQIISKQDEKVKTYLFNYELKIKDLSAKASRFDEMLNNKNKELQFSEQNLTSLVKVVEEQKKKIQNLNISLNEKGKSDEKIKMILMEKDNEIKNLKSFLKSVKSEIVGNISLLFL